MAAKKRRSVFDKDREGSDSASDNGAKLTLVCQRKLFCPDCISFDPVI